MQDLTGRGRFTLRAGAVPVPVPVPFALLPVSWVDDGVPWSAMEGRACLTRAHARTHTHTLALALALAHTAITHSQHTHAGSLKLLTSTRALTQRDTRATELETGH